MLTEFFINTHAASDWNISLLYLQWTHENTQKLESKTDWKLKWNYTVYLHFPAQWNTYSTSKEALETSKK